MEFGGATKFDISIWTNLVW